MLTGIGIIIILKQIPHFFGVNTDPWGDFAFFQMDGKNPFTEIWDLSRTTLSMGSTVIALISLGILILWSNVLAKKSKIFNIIQGPLVAVVVGIIYYVTVGQEGALEINPKNLVKVPVPDDFESFKAQFTSPNWAGLQNKFVWITAFTIALVASLETLLCVEATDKLDPDKRVTPTNRELFAQGSGNIISGLIGGIPITQVIVRSSANIQSGGKTKFSAIFHGIFLLISVILIPNLLNLIPLSVLAAVLFIVGWKLAKPALFKKMWNLGPKQFIPFVVTVLGIVFIDLLWGIGLGLVVGLIVVLIASYKNSYFLHKNDPDGGGPKMNMTLAEEVTFFNKAAILRELDSLPEGTELTLDVRNTRYMDYDIIEILENFKEKAQNRNISVTLVSERGIVTNPDSYIDFFELEPRSELGRPFAAK